jgi:hypothetical protein
MSRKMNKILALVFTVLTVITAVLLVAVLVRADDASLTWTANTEADLAGYKIYRGTAAACTSSAPLPALLVNGSPAQVGKVNNFVDAGLPVIEGTLCWEISAFDTAVPLNESGRSNRVSKVINNIPPLAPAGLGVVVQ